MKKSRNRRVSSSTNNVAPAPYDANAPVTQAQLEYIRKQQQLADMDDRLKTLTASLNSLVDKFNSIRYSL